MRVVAAWILATALFVGIGFGQQTELPVQNRSVDSAHSKFSVPELKAVSHVTLSPDKKHLYAVSAYHQKVLVFDRKKSSQSINQLTQAVDVRAEVSRSSLFRLEQLPDPVSAVANIGVTPNGKYVLATSIATQSVHLFGRDAKSGELTLLFTAHDGVADTIGLHQPFAMAFSPDSRFVYVTNSITRRFNVLPRFGNGCVTAFEIVDQQLKWVETTTGMNDCFDGATDIVMHPSGRWMYVACMNSEAIVVIGREKDGREMGLKQIVRDNKLLSISGASALAISKDGKHLYCASGHWKGEAGITSFRINDEKPRGKLKLGAITPVQVLRRGSPGMEDFAGARQLHLSPSGSHLFALDSARGIIMSLPRDPMTGRLTADRNADLELESSSVSGFVVDPAGQFISGDGEAACLHLIDP